jgi:hypothetical protein
VSTLLTIYLDPYGKFFLGERRGTYPVAVEIADGYRVVEDASGQKSLVGTNGCWTELTPALCSGAVRFV